MIGLHAVTVGGTDISCLVDTVSISHGRDDAGSQPEASSATIALTVDADIEQLPAGVDVGAIVSVTTQTTAGTWDRFSGRVTDLALGWDEAGADTPDSGVGQIVAVGVLADLGRRVVGDVPWPQELDGARVARVMAAAGITLDPAFSDPGTVQLLPRDVDAQQALGVAQAAAVDGAGVLWETRAGQVRYADADHRRGTLATLTLDACDLLVSPTWRRTLEGLVNSVSIGYGVEPAEGGDQPRYVASSPDSITRWGTYAYSGTTELAALADAQAQGQLLLVRNSSPVWVMAALPVDVAGLDAARYDALLALDMHSLLALTGLPSLGHAPTSANLWVEGWKEDLAWGAHQVELVVSGYCRTVPPPRWDDVSPAWLWGDSVRTEQRRNLSVIPTANRDAGWYPNNPNVHSMYRGQPLPAPHPAGITTCATSTPVASGATTIASIYNADGLAAGPLRGAGVWVWCWHPTDVRVYLTDNENGTKGKTAVPAQTWGWCPTAGAGTGYLVVSVDATDGPVTAGEVCWLTGSIAEAGVVPASYFDGDTPDTSGTDYAWTGTPYASASTQSAISTQAGGLPPDLTWDSAACFGPPINIGRWNDQPATLRWDQVDAATTWDTYQQAGA